MTIESDGIAFQEERFAQLQEAKRRRQSIERDGQTRRPRIQRVAHYLRKREKFAEFYSPKLVSFGPIHYGEDNLKLGEQYKLLWTDMYIEDANQSATDLHWKIAEYIKELRELYAEEVVEKFSDKDLTWMLFVDGCSLLQIVRKANLTKPGLLKVKVDLLVLVQMDVLLLENQLPYQVLKLLSNDETQLLFSIENFFDCHHFQVPDRKIPNSTNGASDQRECRVPIDELPPPPNHLLDRLRTIVFGDHQRKKADNNKMKEVGKQPVGDRHQEKQTSDGTGSTNHSTPLCSIIQRRCRLSRKQEKEDFPTYRNIKELKAAGIGVKRDKKAYQTDIAFKSSGFTGTISLSKLIVDETTAPAFLNFIAYEMCPDYDNDFAVSSYIAFLDSLIDHPDDVKDLRSAGVLHNVLGSDEEVAELFNTIATDVVPDTAKYAKVRDQIEEHYKKIHMRWFNQVYSTHFSTPWAIIAFLAALLALALTFIQTVFALPFFSKS